MTKRAKFFFICLFIVLDIFLFIGYIVIRDATMLNELKKEVIVLTNMELSKDRYNRKMKTRGNYALVEKTVKSYLDDTAVLLQETITMTKDEKLSKILSYENYEKDGPLFEESLSYVEKQKDAFTKNMDTLLERLEESSIIQYGNQKIEDPSLRKIYLDSLLSDDMRKEFQMIKGTLLEDKVQIEKTFTVSNQVLEFLVFNQEQWTLEEGEIKFRKQSLYDQYIRMIGNLTVEKKEE